MSTQDHLKTATSKPNILLIMSDQQRFDSLGCYGNKVIDTPNLDRLARGGVLFENCYVNAPICTPSRASIFTGKTMSGHGVYRLHDDLPESEILFPKHLQDIGYSTALIGKLHVSARLTEAERRHPNDGFDVYEWCMDPFIHIESQYNAYTAWLKDKHPDVLERLHREGRSMKHFPADACFSRWAAERTIAFIENQSDAKPFFCAMSLFDPHDPYDDYPLEMADAVHQSKFSSPVGIDEITGVIPDAVIRSRFLHKDMIENGMGIDAARTGYYASIALIDKEVGRVLDALDRQGLRENTLIIFVSDHGDMMGDRGLITKGAYFYDACTKVPFLISLPGTLPAGVRINNLVQPHDIAATILTLAGFPNDRIRQIMPESIDVIQAVGTGGGHAVAGRDHAVCLYRNTGYGPGGRYWDPGVHATMFRDERYKLNVYHQSPSDKNQLAGELFDMNVDPGELNNLWDDEGAQEIKTRLKERLMNWTVATDVSCHGSVGGDASPWARIDEETGLVKGVRLR